MLYAYLYGYGSEATSGVGGTYALKGDGAAVYGKPATDMLLVLGDTVKVTFKNSEAAGAANRFLFDGIDATATRGFIFQTAADLISYSTGNASELKLDGVVVTSGVDAFPMDTDTHIFLMTASGNMTIGNILVNYPLSAFGLQTIIQFETNTAARGIETWDFNTQALDFIYKKGGGSPITLFGVTAEDWVQI